MKKAIKMLIILLCCCISITAGPMYTGLLLRETTSANGLIETSPIAYAAQTQSYINGGVTFNYPPGLFAITPLVTVSVQRLIGTYSVTDIISAEIISNSTSSTTVRVNVGTLFALSESGTGAVSVTLIAFG